VSRPLRSLLVTGGCGFIGSAFLRSLLARPDWDGQVVNLDLLTYAAQPDALADCADDPRYRFVQGDIADHPLALDLARTHAVDAVINFAAETHVDRSIVASDVFMHSNVLGVHALLEVCRATGAHFHQVSTDEVYGSVPGHHRSTEDDVLQPSSPYAASKAAAEHLVGAWRRTYGVSVTTSRGSNTYGPWQLPEKLIPLMIRRALAGEPLPVYGDGLNVRDWLHVDDHADAVWRIAQDAPAGTAWNVGGGNERTNLDVIGELLDAIARQTDRDRGALERLVTHVEDRLGHDRRYALDCGRIARTLGWRPEVFFPAGLEQTVAWTISR